MKNSKSDKKDKMSFSKIEILFMIVMVALLMVAGIPVFTITTNNRNVKNLKDNAIHLSSVAKNDYAYLFAHKDEEKIVVGSDEKTKGVCFTVSAIDKSNKYTNLDGYFVVEKDEDGQIIVSVWLTDGKYVIDGYEVSKINELTVESGINKYNGEEFSKRVETSFTGSIKEKGGLFDSPIRYESECIKEKIE